MKKRYTITSTSFEGELTFTYNEEGILTGFFNDSKMTMAHLQYLHRAFPVVEDLLEQLAGKSETLQIRLTTNEVTFEEFWEAYKYKVDKQEAKKAFDALTTAQQIRAFEQIPSYNYYMMTRPNQNRLYPATYLRGKFDNDYKALAKAAKS